MKIVIGLSGGMDSATMLGILLEQGAEVHCCLFYYGAKHNKYENKAADNITFSSEDSCCLQEKAISIPDALNII